MKYEIIAFSFTKGAYEEVARLKNKGELEIKLITIKELLDKKGLCLNKKMEIARRWKTSRNLGSEI